MKKKGLEPFFFFSGVAVAIEVAGALGFGVDVGVTTARVGTSGTSTLRDTPAREDFLALFLAMRPADFFARELLFFDFPEDAFFTARFATFFAGLLADFFAAFFARFAATELLLARYRRSGKEDQECRNLSPTSGASNRSARPRWLIASLPSASISAKER